MNKGYYGKIDLDKMPPREFIQKWEIDARELYKVPNELDITRFRMEYVWHKIAEWQEDRNKNIKESGGNDNK